MAKSLSPCLYCARVSDGPTGPPDPSTPWHPVHRSRNMRAPASRSAWLASELYWRLFSRLRPSWQWNPVPARVSSKSSVHESSGIPPSAFCRYSRARHEAAVQILSLDIDSGPADDVEEPSIQYKNATPINPMITTARTTAEIKVANFLFLILTNDNALHGNE